MSVHETIKFCIRIFSYINAEGTVKRCQPLVSWSLTWYTRFGRLSNTSHRYRRSILITETYSMHNIDFLAPYTVKLTNIVSYSTVFWLQSLILLCNFGRNSGVLKSGRTQGSVQRMRVDPGCYNPTCFCPAELWFVELSVSRMHALMCACATHYLVSTTPLWFREI